MSGSWMIDKEDPARFQIVERAKALGIAGNPDQPSHALGGITLADGRKVNAHVIHAVDPIITDGKEVVMINRKNDPGMGRPALPGGFLDPARGGGAETGVQAAAREAMEEVGIKLGDGKLVGTRNMDRPFDVRVAQNDMPAYGIKKGDIFMVSTQAVRFDVPNLAQTNLVAGDDALPGSARRVPIASLNRGGVGIPDHFDMIERAFQERSNGGEPPRPFTEAETIRSPLSPKFGWKKHVAKEEPAVSWAQGQAKREPDGEEQAAGKFR